MFKVLLCLLLVSCVTLSPRCIICNVPDMVLAAENKPLAFIAAAFMIPSVIATDFVLFLGTPFMKDPSPEVCHLLPRFVCRE